MQRSLSMRAASTKRAKLRAPPKPWGLPDSGRRKRSIDHAVRSSAQIDGNKPERFIHWHKGMRCAHQSASLAKRPVERLPQANADIFSRMVLIDVEIAGSAHRQVEQTVTRKQVEHMVEEPDAGRNISAA